MYALPWSFTVALVLLAALPTALGLGLAWARARKQRRMVEVLAEVLPNDACLACGSHSVEPLAPEVVRCLACGFVGGEGIGVWRLRQQAEAIQRLPRVHRLASAREKLLMARVQLATAIELLGRALSASRVDMAGLSFDRGREKQSLWTQAQSELESARLLGAEGAALMDDTLPVQIGDPVLSPLLLALDTGWLSDGLVVDAAVHARIRQTRATVDQLRHAIEQQLASLDASLVDAEERSAHD